MGFGDDIHLLKVAGPNGQLAECICVKQQGKHGGPLNRILGKCVCV